ncbi:hypothetical protein WK13_10345 [Burkholderia ubonensis]|nr:hypothetical protein WK13_10345 [Burkholderia ubonensis]
MLSDVFAQRLEPPTAIGAVIGSRQVDPLFALKVIGQRLTARTFATRPFRFMSGRHVGGAFVGLQILQAQFELLDLAVQLFRFSAELHAAQFCDRELQVLDLERPRRELLSQLGNLSVALKQ